MLSKSDFDHHYKYQSRGFLTPQPSWKTRRSSPVMPCSERKPRTSPDLFHVIHKVPSGDSPYVRAKHVQLIEKDPSKAVSFFWAAINYGDRVESALKDMALIMKQLDRPDEAIEAIKSFHHLCPPESQDSLENILLDLYKLSGRFEEEIELLQLKVKQIEEGMAFGGKRTKSARCHGKKVQIPVEKEYSRLLGNIAWAYMQQKDFNSAEENFRKALSFEPDKNKQCNLALCLMHMNKLSEAKFLLQAIHPPDNGPIDESYSKSYERASQMLSEFEAECVLKPMKLAERKNGSVIAGFCSQSPPMPLFLSKPNKRAFTEIPYEKRADFDWRKNSDQSNMGEQGTYSVHKRAYDSPFRNAGTPKSLFTQPRQDQRNARSATSGNGDFCRKLSFVPSNENKIEQNLKKTFPSARGDWKKNALNSLEKLNSKPFQPLERNEEHSNGSFVYYGEKIPLSAEFAKTRDCQSPGAGYIRSLNANNVEKLNLKTAWEKLSEFSAQNCKKSWADEVEEHDLELENWQKDFPKNHSTRFSVGSMNDEEFNDENLEVNVISETPQADKLRQEVETIELESGYFTQPEKANLLTNQSVKRSLCFDKNQKLGSEKDCRSSPLPTKALNFNGCHLALSDGCGYKRRNRLQAFQDITCFPLTPRT